MPKRFFVLGLLFALSGAFSVDLPPQLQNLRSAETLNQNFAKPLFGGGEFKTLDGNQTFEANLQCPSNERAVAITFIPLPYREWRIAVKGDLNLDGKYDRIFDTAFLGVRVSGVCTNGVVYCSPYYAWDLNHCRYYKWSVENGFITLKETQDRGEVGTCTCTNQACNGSNLPPYRWVVGAISNLLMTAYPNLLISKGEWDLSSFTYYLYGQDKERCTGLSGKVTDLSGKPLTDYYSAGVYPSVSLSDLAQVQGSDDSSPYSTLMAASEVEINGYSVGTPNYYGCWVNKDVVIKTVQEYENCPVKYSWNGRQWCVVAQDYKGCGCHVCAQISASLTVKKTQSLYLLVPGYRDNCDNDGNILEYRISGDVNLYGYYTCSNWNFKVTKAVAIIQNANNLKDVTVYARRCHTGHCGCSSESLKLLLSPEYLKDNFSLSIQNSCNPDQNCTLIEEWICPPGVFLPSEPSVAQLRQYCIQTVSDGTKLHPSLSPMCKTVSTQVDTYRICMDGEEVVVTNSRGKVVFSQSGDQMWFKVYRRYVCGTNQMSIDLTKVNQTRDSASMSGQNIEYTNYIGGSGKQTIYINLGNVNSCPVPTCVVKTVKNEADVFSDSSNRAQTPSGAIRYDYDIRSCLKNSIGAWYCPVQRGEVVLEGCSCTRDWTGFDIAVPTLEAINQASHDIICSKE